MVIINADGASTIYGFANCIYEGCTNPTASNYNSLAIIDDSSCYFSGCKNPAAENYNFNADINDGSCLFIDSRLCTVAPNYNFINTGANMTIFLTPNAISSSPLSLGDHYWCFLSRFLR